MANVMMMMGGPRPGRGGRYAGQVPFAHHFGGQAEVVAGVQSAHAALRDLINEYDMISMDSVKALLMSKSLQEVFNDILGAIN